MEEHDGGIINQTLKLFKSYNEKVLVAEGMLPWWLKYLKWKLNNNFLFLPFNCSSFTGRSTRGDTVFDQLELSFNLGEGLEHNIPDGVEQALLKFKKQERSLLKLTPAYGFGSAGNEKQGVLPNVNPEYEVELKSFEKAKESWSMESEEKAGTG